MNSPAPAASAASAMRPRQASTVSIAEIAG